MRRRSASTVPGTPPQPGLRGLSSDEAAPRLPQHWPNELRRRGGYGMREDHQQVSGSDGSLNGSTRPGGSIGCCGISDPRRKGLSSREAERRLLQFGANVLERRGGRKWPRSLARQFTHPLALLLWAAAGLAWIAGIGVVAIAIVAVIVINAVFAFVQEAQAERAVEALAQYLPSEAKVLRDGGRG